MSIRVACRSLLVFALLVSPCLTVLAQEEVEEAKAAEEEPAEEEELDLRKMVQDIKEMLAKQSSKEAMPSKVPFPFGHYAAAARLPEEPGQPAATVESVESAGLPDFTISGKMKMGKQIRLFIGRDSYGVGDTVLGSKIVEITGDTVVLEFAGQKFKKSIP